MMIIIGIMVAGIGVGYLFRKYQATFINKIITLLVWMLLFLLGVEVGGNEQIIQGIFTIGEEALLITITALLGSVIAAWGLWRIVNKKGQKGTSV
ncbi:MAG: LysO family transporter [Phocaeicola sp.]